MVCTLHADCPRATRAARTVRGLWADGPTHTRTVRYPNADGPTNPLQQNFDTSKDLRMSSQEQNKHTMNLHLAGSLRATGGQFTSPRTEQLKVKTEKSTSPIPPWISQTAWALEERFGEDVKRP
jgi:hypothetical protein